MRRPRRRAALAPRPEILESRALLSLGGAAIEGVDPTKILVRFRDGAPLPTLVGPALGIPAVGESLPLVPGLHEVDLRESDLDTALAGFRSDPNVLYAEPNFQIHPNAATSLPYDGPRWDLRAIQSTAAQALLPQGVNPVTVALIDTGVNYNHPDLVGKIWTNPGEIPGNGIDDDNDGYVDDVHGYDFANHDPDPMDDHGHGTHVAGTIVATTNPEVSGLGEAGPVRIMALKIIRADGSGYVEDAIDAIHYAISKGVPVSNNSWGESDYSAALSDAIRAARDADQVFVAAAGNDGRNTDGSAPFYPASFPWDNIISVAATDRDDQLAGFSNYGRSSVDIGAPGVDIYSTYGDGYTVGSGSSMATPHVTGVVAMLRALSPSLGYRKAIQRVDQAADPLASLAGKTSSGGRLNALAALTTTDPLAAFAGSDATTAGNWSGVYGSEGYTLVDGPTTLPSYAKVAYSSTALVWNWDNNTGDTRAPIKTPDGSTGRIMAARYGASFTVDLDLTDGLVHRVGFYMADYDSYDRAQRIEVLERVTGKVLDSREVRQFFDGRTLSWDLRGKVTIRFTRLGGVNALLSGIFFGEATGRASFLKDDATTQGDWVGAYGSDGQIIVGGAAQVPSYARVKVETPSTFDFANFSQPGDPRGLLKSADSTERSTLGWYGDQFTVDLDLVDGRSHRVGFYVLDWDSGYRVQRIDVLDAKTGAVLDSKEVGYYVGRYLSWQLRGHVKLRFTNLVSHNAVLSGIFFGDPPAVPDAAASSPSIDSTTLGDWSGSYGSEGYAIAGLAPKLPSFAKLSFSGAFQWNWANSTRDERAPLKDPGGPDERIATCWYGTQWGLDLDLADGKAHRIALYMLDWETNDRAQRIEVLDAKTGQVLDAREVRRFNGGRYVAWDLQGHVKIRFTRLGGHNAVLSGIFLGEPSKSASFLGNDSITRGDWANAYGADGYAIVGGPTALPSYAGLSYSREAATWTWEASTTDPRALRRSPGDPNDRVAAARYGSSFTMDLDLTDAQVHRVAIYLLDWETNDRAQRIEVLDASTGALLDTREVSGFNGGRYLSWDLRGHVTFRLTRLGGHNAVVGGVFFGGRALPTSAVAAFHSDESNPSADWVGARGSEGYAIVNGATALPDSAKVAYSDSSAVWIFDNSTGDPRGLLKSPTGGGDRAAAVRYGTAFDVDLDLADGKAHRVGLSMIDWDGSERSQRIDIVDATTGAVLDSRTLADFHGGRTLTWDLQGHLILRFTRLIGVNAVLSGLFFDPTT